MEDGTDLSGRTLRDYVLRNTRLPNAWVENTSITGEVVGLFVNGVDVTGYVNDELDRRHPERVQVREAVTPDDLRAAWSRLVELWTQTVARAERLPETARFERVEGEWSIAETLRHLVFATDAWAGRTILDRERAFHPYGLSHTEYPRASAEQLGLDLSECPSWSEIRQIRDDRQCQVGRILDGLTEADLGRVCSRAPAPGYPDDHPDVAHCLRVVLNEECEHHRYAERDLAVLEARRSAPPESGPESVDDRG